MNTVQAFELERRKYGVAISWDTARKNVDLDLQVVLVDQAGKIVDAIFHNNLNAMNGAVAHSGDKLDGGGGPFAEMVWVDFTKMKMGIKLMIFVVAAASGGHLIDVRKGLISVVDSKFSVLAQYTMEASRGDVDAVVMMKRSKMGRWSVEAIDALAEEGTSFLDILDVIGDLVKQEIPEAPETQQCVFITDKGAGATAYKPQAGETRRTVGLSPTTYSAVFSWETESIEVESDVQVLLVNARGHVFDIVNQLNICGMRGAVVRRSEPPEDGVNFDLTYTLDLETMQDAKLAIFMLTVGHGFSLASLKDLSLIFLVEKEDKSKARLNFETAHPQSQSKVLLMLKQSDAGAWTLIQMNEEPNPSATVCDSVQHLRAIVKEFIPHVPEPVDLIRLALGKGSVVWIPPAARFRKAMVSVSCMISTNSSRPDVRMSLVLLDRRGAVMESTQVQQANSAKGQIFFTEPDGKHSANDFFQTFSVALAGAPKQVSQVLVVLLLSKGAVGMIRSATCALGDEAGAELAGFCVNQCASEHSGLVLARLFRQQDRTWAFQAIGKPCNGRSLSDPECVGTIRVVADADLAELGACWGHASKLFNSHEPIDGAAADDFPVSNIAPPPPDFHPPGAYESDTQATATFEMATMEATGTFNQDAEAFVPTAVRPRLLLSGPAAGAHHGRRNRRSRHSNGTT